MTPVKGWIGDFLTRHRERFGCVDWPQMKTEANRQFVLMWIAAFEAHQVEPEEADLASIKLGEIPPRFRIDHIPSLITMIEKIRDHKPAEVVSYVLRGPQYQPPIPPPPGFTNWRTWVRMGCPDFHADDGPAMPAHEKPAVGPDTTHPPQPAGAFE